MKTMNLIIKATVLSVFFVCLSTISFGSNETSEPYGFSSESIIEKLTTEVKSKVNLTDIAKKVKETAIVAVELAINPDGKAVVNNSSTNNIEFEDFVTHKLNNIEIVFPEEYIGKTVIYRFEII